MRNKITFWDVVWTIILTAAVIGFASCLVAMGLKAFALVSLAWPSLIIWMLGSLLGVVVSIAVFAAMAFGEIAAGLVSVFRR